MKRIISATVAIAFILLLPVSAAALDVTPAALSESELEYVNGTDGLTAICCFSTSPYYSYVNGCAVGVIPDMLKIISEKSGLSIELINFTDVSTAMSMISNKEVDLIFDAAQSYGWETEYGYTVTNPYLTEAYSMLRLRNEKSRTAHIAVCDSPSAQAAYAKRYYYSEQLLYFKSNDECFDALNGGKCDSAIMSSYMAELIVAGDERNRYISTSMPGGGEPIGIAVKNGLPPELLSVLNKTIAGIDNATTERCIARNTAHRNFGMTATAYVYKNPQIVFGIALTAVLLMFMSYLLIRRNMRLKEEHLRAENEKRRNGLLSDALAAAEKADAAKSRFLSRVSHEMRTPLNAIIGFMSLAKDCDQQQVNEYLSNSEIAAKQLLAVINDVLDMSAIEAGKMKIAALPFNFRKLLNSLAGMYTPQCEQKGLRFEISLVTPVDDWLVGDQLRLNQILINLIGNAVKFTDNGFVRLHVSKLDQRDNKTFLRFEVSDTGCGISENMRSRLFKSFEQESMETAQKYGGSGLGLSIVKNLVSMMDGAIRVESTPGNGTTFTVDLPFGVYQPEATTAPPEDVSGIRVIAVDDNETEHRYFSDVLTHMGVRFTCAKSGDEALELLDIALQNGDPYNVAVIDWQMPGMNGLEVTKRIRESYGDNITVIIASAYADSQSDDNARDAGADIFMAKPLFQSSLFDIFMSLTAGAAGRRASKTDYGQELSGMRVLLVEDNIMNRMVAVGLLEKFGVICDVSENGRMAVDKFSSSGPGYYDAILMDIQMPVMNGIEATKTIRDSAHPDAVKIQIIALTANAFTEDVTMAMSSGMNGYVSKPIDPSVLFTVLKNAYDKRSR